MISLKFSPNMLIIISIVVFILIVACMMYIIYKDKKEDREEIDDLLDDLVKAKPRKKELVTAKIEVPIGIDPNEKETQKMDLEAMLNKMQENLDTKEEETISHFELEQEEKAIISYQELVKNMNEETLKKDIETYELEQETSYQTAKDQVKEFLMREEPKLKNNDSFYTESTKIKKIESPAEKKSNRFQNTDFISPIFGKMNAKIEYPKIKLFEKPKTEIEKYFEEDYNQEYKHAKIEYDQKQFEKQTPLENMIDVLPFNHNTNQNDDFLNALKEFRSNL